MTANGDTPGGGFDRIELTLARGDVRKMTRAEFEAMELDERVRALIGKRVRFFSGATEVPVREALSASPGRRI